MKNKYLWLGLIIKFALFALVPSLVARELFIPFLDKAILNFGANPWSLSPPQSFPYGGMLYIFMFVPKYLFYLIFGDAALGSTFLSYTALRLPILIADIAFLNLLFKFPSIKKNWIYWFYWLNPVLLFINYVHVQLDIFAILFLMLALYSLLIKKELLSAVRFSAALLCKFHVIIALPLFLVYFWNTKFRNESLKRVSQWSAIVVGLVVIGFLPHMMSESIGYVSVSSPEAARIFSLALNLNNMDVLLIGFGILVAVLARLVLSSRVTPQGMIYASGLMMGVLLVTTASMPGWYYWLYPFIALFLAQYSTRLHTIVIASMLVYLIHFVPVEFDYSLPPLIQNVSFTILQMTLLGTLVAIWMFVIRFEMPWFRRSRPLLIGIAGNSGAGKNTISEVLHDLFGQKVTSIVEGDDYHKWERGNEKWQDYTHLNPRANYLETLAQHTLKLLQGQPVYKSHYDHSSGQFTDDRLISTSKNIIVQGLHTFYPLILRKIMDIKIFISPSEQLRTFWKIRRDVGERGHDLEKVARSIAAREQDSLAHIEPQKKFSDWILSYSSYDLQKIDITSLESLKMVDLKQEPKIFQVHHIVNDTPIEILIEKLKQIKTLKVICEPDIENLDFLRIEIHGTITQIEVEQVAESSFGVIRHLTRSNVQPTYRAGFEGVNQLIFLSLVLRSEMRL